MIQLTGCIRMTSPFSTQTGTAGRSSVKKEEPPAAIFDYQENPESVHSPAQYPTLTHWLKAGPHRALR